MSGDSRKDSERERRRPDHRMAKVSFGGVVKDVNLAYVPEAGVGDYVIVHVGVRPQQVDEDEAAEIDGDPRPVELEEPRP